MFPALSATLRCVVESDGARRRGRADQRGPLLRVGVRQQARDRVAHERRVAEVAVAVGVGEPAALQERVQHVRAAGERRAPLHDVERLQHRRPARRRRAHAVDLMAEVRQLDGLAHLHAVAPQVALREQPGPPGVVGARAGRGVLHGGDDRVGDRPAVEALGDTEPAHALVRAREVRVADRGPDVLRRAVGVEVELGGRRDVVEPRGVRRRLVEERLVDGEPLARRADAVGERVAQLVGAVAAQQVRPRVRRARDAHAQPAVAVDRELRVRRRPAVDEEARRRHPGGRLLTRVDRGDPPALALADDHEAAAADAAAVRLHHPQHRCRGDRGVERVPALLEDVDRRLRGERVDARRGPAATVSCGALVLRLRGRRRQERRGRGRRQPPAHARLPTPCRGPAIGCG
jgi:hypothetical protein